MPESAVKKRGSIFFISPCALKVIGSSCIEAVKKKKETSRQPETWFNNKNKLFSQSRRVLSCDRAALILCESG